MANPLDLPPDAIVDIHTHVLPGLDDGAQTIEDSIAMARVAADDGIAVMVATPHFDLDYERTPTGLPERVAEVSSALAAAGVSVQVLTGGEAYVTPDLPDRVAKGIVPTLNGSRYILVEWPLQQYPTYGEQVMFGLQLKLVTPILAHAERYLIVQQDPNLVARLIDRGILVQVSSGSLMGVFGARAQRTAEILLTHNLAHVLASDGHSATHRPPVLAAATKIVARLIGEKQARAMVTTVPRAIVENLDFQGPAPRLYKPRPIWAFWR